MDDQTVELERLGDALHRLVENACTCAKEAGRQGDPMDPEYARDMLLRRRRSMLLAGTGDAFKPGVLSGSVAPESLYIPPLFSKPEE